MENHARSGACLFTPDAYCPRRSTSTSAQLLFIQSYFLHHGPIAEYARSGSSLSTDYGSWQIVSGCGSIHDLPPVPSESPFPFSFQDEGPSGRMCTFVPERQVRLEAVRELFLSAYSSTVGLKSSSPSPSGAISGLLEQFARGVGLRGTNAII
ncbi:hypothetical protein PO909_005918 [Leuciscus waleckii]